MFPVNRRALLKTVAATAPLAFASPAEARVTRAGHVRGILTGAKALVDSLQAEGVGCVYGIPGAQANEFWDTMKQKGLPYLLCTHEFAAATMADGYARSTGMPGVLAVVPGPGATNACTGLGEALLDSVPLVAIVGDVARGEKYRPFQVHEIPVHLVLEGVCKKVLRITCVEEIPQIIHEAFRVSQEGEPGPVAVMVPYTILIDSAHFNAPPEGAPRRFWSDDALARAVNLLACKDRRIGIYAGLGCMDHGGLLTEVAEMLQAPVATSVSGKGAIDESHSLAVGWGYGPAGTQVAEEIFAGVDTILAIGVRYSEVSTGFYSIPQKPYLVHVDACEDNLERVVPTTVAVHADSGLFLGALLGESARLTRCNNPALPANIAGAKARQLASHQASHSHPRKGSGGVDPMHLILAMNEAKRDDSLVFVDVTVSEHWAAEAFTVRQPRTYFNPTDNQGMGWSIPAAIGAQQVHRDRQVFTLTGDGCFLMAGQEISTAARECLPVKFFVLDDHAYHYMQLLQSAAYDRTTATHLAKLDFEALARGYGVGYREIGPGDDLCAEVSDILAQPTPILVRVITEYTSRPVRWLAATKSRYTTELSVGQKARFAARLGVRSLQIRDFSD